MLNRSQKFGKKGENIAAKALRKRGYRILEKNYRAPMGEIDIIAKDKDVIVFVEVKTRSSDSYGDPKLSINRKKQIKISMSALDYLKKNKKSDAKARFDVVAISLRNGMNRIEIVKNAFELAWG